MTSITGCYNLSCSWKAKNTMAAATGLSEQPWTMILRNISTDVGMKPWDTMALVQRTILTARWSLPVILDHLASSHPQLKSSHPSQGSNGEPKQMIRSLTISSSTQSVTIFFCMTVMSIARHEYVVVVCAHPTGLEGTELGRFDYSPCPPLRSSNSHHR